MTTAIRIKNLTKQYDKFKLDNINLEIPKGIIVGLIGENGAGKTTLIKLLLNIIHPDEGQIQIFGNNNDKLNKEDIGVVLDNMFFPEILTAKDIASIMKSMYQKWDNKQYEQYLQDFKIPNNKKIKELSKGMRKKLEIAVALSHQPKLLILDEPTSGLDPVVRNDVLEIFLKFLKDEDHTILISTHITSDLEQIADQIIFINEGKIIMNESKDNIIDNYGILKCNQDYFEKIDKEDIITYQKSKYNYRVLVTSKNKVKKKYPECIIDKVTLEELMVLMIKGEKTC